MTQTTTGQVPLPLQGSPSGAAQEVYDDDLVKAISNEIVYDGSGKEHRFGELIKSSKLVIVIYIRHMGCGYCQEYLMRLNKALTVEQLETANACVVVIGQGAVSYIEPYKKLTDIPFAFYTQPSKSIFTKLGMSHTLKGSKTQPSYTDKSTLGVTLMSIKNLVKMGQLATSGDIAQNGGEQIWKDGKIVFAHNMQNSQDHLAIPSLIEKAGLA